MLTEKMLTKFYFGKDNWKDGTTEYHGLLRRHIHSSHRILELGSGPNNRTTKLLRELGQSVTGLDIDPRILNNENLDEKFVYEGKEFPASVKSVKFDIVTCDYVMEHVEFPKTMMKEIFSCLKVDGLFIFRTPNKYHYVSIISAFSPHWFHLLVANFARRNSESHVDPYPTFYRFNSYLKIKKVINDEGFIFKECQFIEKEPSYLKFNILFFFLGMGYERTVNRFSLMRQLRSNLFVVIRKVNE